MSRYLTRRTVSLLFFLAALSMPAAGEEPPVVELGPEIRDEAMELVHRAPEGIEPGESVPVGEFGGRHLAYFFSVPGAEPVRVKIETYPTQENLEALVRLRKGKRAGGEGVSLKEAPFEGGGFDSGVRFDWGPDGAGRLGVELYLKRFRRLTVVTMTYLEKDGELYSRVLAELIGSFRSVAEKPCGIPVPKGWRVETKGSFEIVTDGHADLAEALADFLEAGLKELRKRFPGLREPEFPCLVKLYGSAEGFAEFREEHKIPVHVASLFFEEARLVLTGPLPRGKQTRRFGRWELDASQIIRVLFEQYMLHGLGTRPEAWFYEGAGLYMGIGFGGEGRFVKERVEQEVALSIEEALTSRKALRPPEIFERDRFTDDERVQAAGWVHFLASGPGQSRKKRLQTYLEAFRESWDGPKAREKAFEGVNFKSLIRMHARYYLYIASRVKRGR